MPDRRMELIGPAFKTHSVTGNNPKIIEAEYVGPVCCPDGSLTRLRTKDRIQRRNRRLLSLMRRHASKLHPDQKLRLDRYFDAHPAGPAARILYEARKSLCALMNINHRTKKTCWPLIKQLVDWIWKLHLSGLPAIETLAETLDNWSSEIACMWRFTKNKGITEGFHTKMEMIRRRVFEFKNSTNYRLRVMVMCD